ncbi:MAG TPA: hypothetical protein VF808_10580 [Ktedonobacterales bacterium]
MAQFFPPQLGQFLIIILLVSPLLAFWAWMFTDMTRNNRLPENIKNQWALAFILLNIFGAALYYLNVYRNR